MNSAGTVQTGIGTVELTAINDLSQTLPVTDMFPSLNKETIEKYEALYPNRYSNGKIDPFTYYCYLIQDGQETVLFDAGVGGGEKKHMFFFPDLEGALPEELDRLGIRPEDITMVVFSHIHADHVGWSTAWQDGEYVKTFPNARYIAQRSDYDAWHNDVTTGAVPPECFNVCIQPLYDRGEIELIDVEQLKLTDHITLRRAPGHTPGIQYMEICSEGKTAVLAGDIFAGPIQVTDPAEEYVWDLDKETALKNKQMILNQYADKEPVFGGAHFGIGRIVKKNGENYWEEIC